MKPRQHLDQHAGMDLSHLSEAECEIIFSVLQKDFEIRALEKARLRRIFKTVKDEDYAAEILTQNNHEFEEKHCLRCFGSFIFFFNPAVYCFTCRLKVCRRCTSFVRDFNSFVCTTCLRDRDYITASCPWYYEEIRRRFRQPSGSAKVARSLSLSGGKNKNSISRSKRSLMDPEIFQSNVATENVCSSDSDNKSLSSVDIQTKSNKVRSSFINKGDRTKGEEEVNLLKNLQGQQVARFHESVDNVLKNLHEDLRSGNIATVTLKELPAPGTDIKYDMMIKGYRDRIAQFVANFAQLLYVAFENANVNLCQSTDDLHEQVQDLVQVEVERLLGYNIDNIIHEEVAEEEESSVGLAGGRIENRLSCAIVNKALEEHSTWLQNQGLAVNQIHTSSHAQRVPGLSGEWLFGEVDPDLLSLSGSRMDVDDEIDMYRKGGSSHHSFADSWSAAALFERSGGAAEVAKALYHLAADKSQLNYEEDDNSDGLSDLDYTCLPDQDEENVDSLVKSANLQQNSSKMWTSDSADTEDFDDIYRQNLSHKKSVQIKELLGVPGGNLQLKSQLKGDAFWYRIDISGMVALDEKQHDGKYMTESGVHNDVHVLKISHLATSDEGEYLCIVVNGEDCDNTSETFRVALLDLPASLPPRNTQLETKKLSQKIAGTRQATSSLAESTKTSAMQIANLQLELQNVEDRLDDVASDVSQSTYGLRSVTNHLTAELVRAERKINEKQQELSINDHDFSSDGNISRIDSNLHGNSSQAHKEQLEESVYASAGKVFSLKERLKELETSLEAAQNNGKNTQSHAAEWDRLQAEVERSVQLCEESQHRIERLELAAEELGNRQHNFEELKDRFSREKEGLKRISSITMRTLPHNVAQRVDLRRTIFRTEKPSEMPLSSTQKHMSPAMNSPEKVISISAPVTLSTELITNSPTRSPSRSRASSGSLPKDPNESYTSKSPEFTSIALRKTGRDLRGINNSDNHPASGQ